MKLSTAVVPITNAHVIALLKFVNLAFDDHDVIRPNGKARFGERLEKARQIATGVDNPYYATLLKCPNYRLQLFRNRRNLPLRVESPVEIGRDQFYGRFHRK